MTSYAKPYEQLTLFHRLNHLNYNITSPLHKMLVLFEISYTCTLKWFLRSILHLAEVKTMMKCPKRVIMKASYENKEVIDNDGSCFSPRSLFALPPDGSSLMLDSLHFVEENSDQDLLLDVPSNGSFPQAELLHPALSFGAQQASTSSSSIYPYHNRR
jgi:hypothetical protein